MEFQLYLNLLWGVAEIGCEELPIINPLQWGLCYIHPLLVFFLSDMDKVTSGRLSVLLLFLGIRGGGFDRSLISKNEPTLLLFESSCRISIFHGMWDAEAVNVVPLCLRPFFLSRFCLEESWILGRYSCKSCVHKGICADPSSKQYLALGIVEKQLPADVTL